MKILTVIGARPQFVKAAVVSRAFRTFRPDIREIIVHTGQHYDANMSDVFFEELEIPRPDFHLGIGGGTHGQNTGRMLEAIEGILLEQRPDWMLVYGDTDSTLAGALAAAKVHIPIAHVEAGLRAFNREIPEEVNRVLTDHLASLLLTPTDTATANLAKEGLTGTSVQQVGDVMYDAALFYSQKARRPAQVPADTPFILSTIHRASNTDNPETLASVIGALNELGKNSLVVLPLHPRTRKKLADTAIDTSHLLILDPVGYLEMVWLLNHTQLVVTDSGGLQKEAYFFQKPCVITREETEWVELLDAGWNVLAGTKQANILEACFNKLDPFQRPSESPAFYGNGDAGQSIAELDFSRFTSIH